MISAVLLLGSNLNDREQCIRDAAGHIDREIGHITRQSSLYETDPWGFTSEQAFLNQVLVCQTVLSPMELLHAIKRIESGMGRVRNGSKTYTSRTIDIDILFYEKTLVDSPELTVPHPRLHERNFTLVPLQEIMPGFIHPLLKKSIQELLQACPDQLAVKRYAGGQDL
jgi:2-amino-4-hydroxy-6-hydroxymethyldihydropteridine diphosphokinase